MRVQCKNQNMCSKAQMNNLTKLFLHIDTLFSHGQVINESVKSSVSTDSLWNILSVSHQFGSVMHNADMAEALY